MMKKPLWVAVSFLLFAGVVWAQTSDVLGEDPTLSLTPATHSHNDYYQPRPLLDALDAGMASIEADIFYVEIPFVDAEEESRAMRQLWIAHDWEEIEGNVLEFQRTKGTLRELYLEPLWEIYQRTGTIYPDGTLLLHADMKTATERTWRVLENTLRNYPGLFTRYELETQTVIPGPVTVYTNDEPDASFLSDYDVIHSTADGRFGDIYDPSAWASDAYQDRAWRMPIISSNLQSYNDITQMFEFLVPEEDIVEAYADAYPDLTAENLAEELNRDNWALATDLLHDGSIRVTDYLRERMVEANRLGQTYGHLMRFWAPPDAKWFWDIVAPLPHVVLLTDHPGEVKIYLENQALLDEISAR
ncbi:MAG: hypothetical protein U5K81_09845 [Trueperaceae bacterium]|nr:hypothetical protein [Trueperaceae bacterium]